MLSCGVISGLPSVTCTKPRSCPGCHSVQACAMAAAIEAKRSALHNLERAAKAAEAAWTVAAQAYRWGWGYGHPEGAAAAACKGLRHA
jgi:hypothetical protein